MMLGYNLMQQNLLKTTSRSNAASNTQFKNGVLASQREYLQIAKETEEEQAKQLGTLLGSDPPTFKQRFQSNGSEHLQVQEASRRLGFEIDVSMSQGVSQVLSVNEFGGEDYHPLITSNINNRLLANFDRVSLFSLRNATSELRRAQLELTDFVEEQRQLWSILREELTRQFIWFAAQFVKTTKLSLSSNKASNCSKCRGYQAENSRMQSQLKNAKDQFEKVLSENQSLQEFIFDLEQKVVGVELQIQRRLKQRSKHVIEVTPILEDNKELIQHLQSEIAQLKEDQITRERRVKEWESRLSTDEKQQSEREAKIKQTLVHLQELKEANYQREHQILAAEENLSKKISNLRKKEIELSEWEAELALKFKDSLGLRDNTLAQQFPSNSPSFQNSGDELNQSEVSLKSFGRNKVTHGSPTSQGQLGNLQSYYKKYARYNNDEEKGQLLIRERQNYLLQRDPYLREGYGESGYVPKGKEVIINKRYNPQLSSCRESRDASPYRHIIDLSKTSSNLNNMQSARLRNSPNRVREASSTSKSRVSSLALQNPATSRATQRNTQLGGLGSKLQRLREEIKREIQSIK